MSVKTCDWKLKNVVLLFDICGTFYIYIHTSWIADYGMIMQEIYKSAEDPAWADGDGCVLCVSDVRLVWGAGFVCVLRVSDVRLVWGNGFELNLYSTQNATHCA